MNNPYLNAGLWLVCLYTVFFNCACKDKQDIVEQVAQEKTNKSNPSTKTAKSDATKAILFFGNSLTAGYGLDENQSFPSLIQERIDSLQLEYRVINAGLSGETSAGGKNRIDWVLRQPIDVFVLELGANDVLRGLELKSTQDNLRSILKSVRSKYPDVSLIIAGMEAPPNMGVEYTSQFKSIYSKLAQEFNAGLIPFLLDGVAGHTDLNLPDAMHPNATGQYIVRDNVWKILKNYL